MKQTLPYKILFDSCTEEERYCLEERATIHEFDGKLSREEAELCAVNEFYEKVKL